MKYETPEQCYDDFWKEIVENEDGSINLDQIKKELFDFCFMMDNTAEVFCEVSGNRISKPMTPASGVICCFQDLVDETVRREIDDLVECGELVRAETLEAPK